MKQTNNPKLNFCLFPLSLGYRLSGGSSWSLGVDHGHISTKALGDRALGSQLSSAFQLIVFCLHSDLPASATPDPSHPVVWLPVTQPTEPASLSPASVPRALHGLEGRLAT